MIVRGQCKVCTGSVEPFISFGKMPIANGFLCSEDFAQEFFFDLGVGICSGCSMVQLTQLVDPGKLFHETYAFFSSTSVRMAKHFKQFAHQALENISDKRNPFIVEIGSNDGIMLKNIAQAGIRHLGVEPSENVARVAVQAGLETRCCFFNQDTASEIRQEYGPADAILGANVICHIPDLHSLIRGVDRLLKEDGIFIFEEPYLGDIVERTSYDQFYDEHVYYFCLSSLSSLFDKYGMAIVDAERQEVHGGSMRYTVVRKANREGTPRLAELKAQEARMGLGQQSTFLQLKDRIDVSRDQLKSLLESIKQDGKRVVGYGATSKSTTVTNYAGIGPDLVEFISDTTPTKQGMFSPGTHIPVKPYDEFLTNYPDYALLFAWNHGEEIIAKEKEFLDRGGRFISFVPDVRVLE